MFLTLIFFFFAFVKPILAQASLGQLDELLVQHRPKLKLSLDKRAVWRLWPSTSLPDGLEYMRRDLPSGLMEVYVYRGGINPSFDSLYLEARQALQQARYLEAQEALYALLHQNPSFAPAHRLLGQCFLQQKQVLQAEKALVAALKYNPIDYQAACLLSQCQIQQKRCDLAVQNALLGYFLQSQDLKTQRNLVQICKQCPNGPNLPLERLQPLVTSQQSSPVLYQAAWLGFAQAWALHQQVLNSPKDDFLALYQALHQQLKFLDKNPQYARKQKRLCLAQELNQLSSLVYTDFILPQDPKQAQYLSVQALQNLVYWTLKMPAQP